MGRDVGLPRPPMRAICPHAEGTLRAQRGKTGGQEGLTQADAKIRVPTSLIITNLSMTNIVGRAVWRVCNGVAPFPGARIGDLGVIHGLTPAVNMSGTRSAG